jgi:hypothetical protein
MMSDAIERAQALTKELDRLISRHDWKAGFDAFAYQVLVIVAATSGFASLLIGLAWKNAALAGALGLIPSVATILISQLQCVRAENWHLRMLADIKGLRYRLLFELPNPPSADQVAAISRELRSTIARLTAEWEKVAKSGPIEKPIHSARATRSDDTPTV